MALHDLYAQKGKYVRLKKGLSALIDSFKEEAADEKLHQLARAIEAIIKPEQGRTERQFIHRCKVFGGGKKNEEVIYREAYQLRSAIEHMNSWDAVLSIYKTDIEKTGSLRAFQMQLLACHTYIRILNNRTLWQHFETDATVDVFWKQKDDELQKIWGPQFNFINEAQKDFHSR